MCKKNKSSSTQGCYTKKMHFLCSLFEICSPLSFYKMQFRCSNAQSVLMASRRKGDYAYYKEYAVQSNTNANGRFRSFEEGEGLWKVGVQTPGSVYNATSSTRLTSRTCEPARSSRTGMRSRSSLSCASENQLLMGTACCGWNMYEVGELSMMIVSFNSRPTWERSYSKMSCGKASKAKMTLQTLT